MRKKAIGVFAILVFSVIGSGCATVQNYSIRSYQGPLPMDDYGNLNPGTYGVSQASR